MARPPRLMADRLISHALNRGRKRPAVLSADTEPAAFLEALSQTCAHGLTFAIVPLEIKMV